jgi:Ni/Co efflux regulator RcnB
MRKVLVAIALSAAVFAAGAASATASNPMDAYAKTVKKHTAVKHHMAPKHHKHHVMKHKHHTKHMKRVARKKPAGM